MVGRIEKIVFHYVQLHLFPLKIVIMCSPNPLKFFLCVLNI